MAFANRRRGLASLVAALAAASLAGCGSLFQPYLTTTTLDATAACQASADCAPTGRFRSTVQGVEDVQKQARDGYTERAILNSTSSALAFPMAAGLLYAGATVKSTGGRNGLLKAGLGVGALYETRNALESGSPESTFILADARLGCVLDEASRYQLDAPAAGTTCSGDLTSLISGTDALENLTGFDVGAYGAQRDNLVAKARGVIAQYVGGDRTLLDAVGAMRRATRQIVTDTNTQLHSPTFTPTSAGTFVKSEASAYFPASAVTGTTDKTGQTATGGVDIVAAMQKLSSLLNKFGSVCLRPQPATTTAFDACTKFSPEAPPPASITTTLPSTTVTLNAGDPLSFIATSQPSGTPWAMYASNGGIAQQYLGDLHQVTLSPSQTQVTLHYGAAAVPTDTDVALSLATLGGTGGATTITLKLKAAVPATPDPVATPAATPAAATPNASTTFASVKKDTKAMAALSLNAQSPDADISAALATKYRALCGTTTAPAAKLRDAAFLKAIDSGATHLPNAAFCK